MTLVPRLRTRSISADTADNADSVCAHLLNPDKEFISSVDIAIGSCSGFLRELPESYRKVIGVTYLDFMRSCEQRMNEKHAKALVSFQQTFQSAYSEGKEGGDLLSLWNFSKLQKEDDLLEEELIQGFGPTNWGHIDLKVKEQEFTPDRWMVVLFNKSTQPEETKREEVNKIRDQKFDDIELIDAYLPQENSPRKKSTIFGLFVQNVMFHLENRCQEMIKLRITGKVYKAQKVLITFTNAERLLLLFHYYIETYRSLLELRLGPIKTLVELLNTSKAEYKPTLEPHRNLQEVLVQLKKASPRISSALSSSPRQGSTRLPPVDVEKFYTQVHKCKLCIKHFLVMLKLEKQRLKALCPNMSTLSINDTDAEEPIKEPPSPKTANRLAMEGTVTKIKANRKAFKKMQELFKKIHQYYRKKTPAKV